MRTRPTLWMVIALGALCAPATGSAQDPPIPDTLTADTAVVPDSLLIDATAQDSVGPAIEAVSDDRAALDEAIRNQLQAVFDRVPALAAVTVSVDAGVVVLAGTTPTNDAREGARDLATQQVGVLFVDNRIRESTSLEEQLEPTWNRLREVGYGTAAKLPLFLVALFIVGIAAVGGSLLARWASPLILRIRNPFLHGMVRKLVAGVVVVAGLLVALDLMEATALVGAVVGTAGVAGIAVGFAFKDIVENYLAGVLMAFRQPFAKNDQIKVDTFEGKVVRLTARETILMTLEGNHVRLPNAMVFRSPMLNYTRNPLRRFHFDAGLGPNDDLARAREVAIAALSEMEGVLDTPAPEALIMELGDSTVTLRFMGWVDQNRVDFARVRSEAIRLVKARLEETGLTFPSPEFLLQMRQDPSPPPPPPSDEPQSDVSVDRSVDEQIEADRRASTEGDLLDREGNGRRSSSR